MVRPSVLCAVRVFLHVTKEFRDVERHISGLTHKSKSREISEHPKIMYSFLPQSTSIHEKVTSPEVKFTGFVLEHNLPLNVADHTGPLFRSMFPDSKNY